MRGRNVGVDHFDNAPGVLVPRPPCGHLPRRFLVTAGTPVDQRRIVRQHCIGLQLPGAKIGEIINSPLNPVIYSRD